MLAVGYSDHSRAFIVRNSWGDDWVNRSFYFKNLFFCMKGEFRVIKAIVIFHMIIWLMKSMLSMYGQFEH